MGTLHIILNIVLILASAALVVSVLMQKTKSSGLGSAFGSDTASFNTARNKAVSKEAKLQSTGRGNHQGRIDILLRKELLNVYQSPHIP